MVPRPARSRARWARVDSDISVLHRLEAGAGREPLPAPHERVRDAEAIEEPRDDGVDELSEVLRVRVEARAGGHDEGARLDDLRDRPRVHERQRRLAQAEEEPPPL